MVGRRWTARNWLEVLRRSDGFQFWPRRAALVFYVAGQADEAAAINPLRIRLPRLRSCWCRAL